jgi:N-methylhydantoinase A
LGGYAIGVDIGGTFTDLVLAQEGAGVEVLKVPTNRDHPEEGVYDALRVAAERLGISLGELLRDVTVFVHGTTIATNTIVQKNGPKIGVICTDGHRDVLYLRDGLKPERYNLRMDPPEPFVPRYLRLGLSERIIYTGKERRPVELDELDRILDFFQQEHVESIAVTLLWAGRNPSHELQVLERIQERLPGVFVCASSDVLPVIGEWKRTSATVLSAYIKPGLSQYLRSLESLLRKDGLSPRLLVMQANGGAATVNVIDKRPVFAVGSGPAASPAAALRVGTEFGRRDLIAVDMGGTSFDVAVIKDGHASVSNECKVADLPLGVDALDIISIGAGGGSIAWIDSGGALRVGPQSAGSSPGPASYDRGGVRPTVTDADLILGYLDPSNPLGGTLVMQQRLAEEAIRTQVADQLGLSVPQAAAAIFTIVNHNMVEAIRLVSIARGTDPRNFALVVGGGAGPVHGGRLAQILGLQEVIVPREAGAFCAMGMIAADVRHDYVQLSLVKGDELTDAELARLNHVFEELEAKALDDLKSEGFDASAITFRRYVDARYRQQFHDLTVPAPPGTVDRAAIAQIAAAFHTAHEAAYTYSLRESMIDVVHARLSAFGHVPTPAPRRMPLGDADPSPALKGERLVYFEDEYRPTPVYDADALRSGMRIDHPSVVERATTTVVVFPGQELEVNEYGSFRVLLRAVEPRSETLTVKKTAGRN